MLQFVGRVVAGQGSCNTLSTDVAFCLHVGSLNRLFSVMESGVALSGCAMDNKKH